MDVHEQINAFKEYIETNQKAELYEADRKGELFFELDYKKIARFNLDLANEIIEYNPTELIKAAQIALESFDLENKEEWQPLITNLPESTKIPLNEIADQLGLIKTFEGNVMKPTDIHLKMASARFECPACLPKGTKVLTKEGFKPIEEATSVVCIDYHLKPTIRETITPIYTGKKDKWIINEQIECSDNHKWFVYRKGVTEVIQTKDLKIGDIFYKINHEKMHNMPKGTSNSFLSKIWKKGENTKENMFKRMLEEIQCTISNRWRKNQSRQQRNNTVVCRRKEIINSDRKDNWEKSQISKKKTSKIQHSSKNSKRTMQDKFKELKGLQAWKEMWRKRLHTKSTQDLPYEMQSLWESTREVWQIISNSPYQRKPFRQQDREFDDIVPIMPFEVTSFRKTEEKVDMYDLQVPDYNNFILGNGVITHNCGNVIAVLMPGRIERKPKSCGCGRKGNFIMLSKKFIKFQMFDLLESFDTVPDTARKPARKQVLITENLTRKEINGKLQPGQKVKITGWLDVEQMGPIRGKPSNEYRTFIIANNIELIERSWKAIKLNSRIKKQCTEMNSSTLLSDFAQSMAPTFEGYDILRQSLILQHVGGKRLFDKNGNLDEREIIHILLSSGPGKGKTYLIKRSAVISPLWNWSTGHGLSLEYNQPLIYKHNGEIKTEKIGLFCEKIFNEKDYFESYSFYKGKWQWCKINQQITHKCTKDVIELQTKGGKSISVTTDHSVFTVNDGKIIAIKSEYLKEGDVLIQPRHIQVPNNLDEDVELAYFLGWYVAEGWTYYNKSSYNYRVGFGLHKKEEYVAKKLIKIIQNKIGYKGRYVIKDNSLVVTFDSKKVYYFIKEKLGCCFGKDSKTKRIPEVIFNLGEKSKRQFLRSYLDGDAGVTVSKYLASDIQYLCSMLNEKATYSFYRLDKYNPSKINGREIKSKNICYNLRSHRSTNLRVAKPVLFEILSDIQKQFVKNPKNVKSRWVSRDDIKFNWTRMILKLEFLEKPKTWKEIQKRFGVSWHPHSFNRVYGKFINKLGKKRYILNEYGSQILEQYRQLCVLLDGNLETIEITKIIKKQRPDKVYDISTQNENFLGGFGGLLCHNTSAGLVACISKDDFGNYTLDAGPLVMSDGGIFILDEMDKLDKAYFGSLNNAMNDEQTKITKATVDQMLRTRTSVLATANPKHKVFNDDEPILDQLKPIPKDILDRFDLIWIMDEHVDSDKLEQKYMARHQEGSELVKPKYTLEQVRYYITYAKRLVPVLHKEESDYFIKKYQNFTGQTKDNDSKRIRGNLLRVIYAYAKFHGVGLEDQNNQVKVTKQAIDYVFDMFKSSFKSLRVFDETTNSVSYESLESIPDKKEVKTYYLIRDVMEQNKKTHNNQIPYEVLLHKVRSQKDITENELYNELEKLKKNGEVFEPRRGKWGLL